MQKRAGVKRQGRDLEEAGRTDSVGGDEAGCVGRGQVL